MKEKLDARIKYIYNHFVPVFYLKYFANKHMHYTTTKRFHSVSATLPLLNLGEFMMVKSVQPKPDFEIYMEMMEGIKCRIEVVKGLMKRNINMMYDVIQVESIALQIRMIVESIALASLSANKSIFEREGDRFKEFWKAKLIFRDIKNINPDFFPKPLEEFPSDTPGEENITNSRYIEEGFMTDDEMIEVYDQVCKFLHVKNPYSDEKVSVLDIGSKAANWINRIIKLLNSHEIKLLNNDNFYVVHMYEPDRGGRAAMYEFYLYKRRGES